MRKLLFVGIIFVIAVVFGFFMWSRTKQQSTQINTAVSTETPTIMPTAAIKGDGTTVVVGAGSVEAEVGRDVMLEVRLDKLEGPMLAADIIIVFDPQSVDYVGITETHPEFDIPRKTLVSDGRVLLSFINKPTSTIESGQDFKTSLTLGKIQFRPKRAGTTTITPEFDGSNKSSMVYLDGENDNQLTEAVGADIVIK